MKNENWLGHNGKCDYSLILATIKGFATFAILFVNYFFRETWGIIT